MKVTIDDSFTLESDAYSFMLKQNESDRVNEKTGNPVIHVNYTYHPTIRHALKHYINESTKKASTAQQILERIDEAMQKIDGLEFPTLVQTRKG